MKHTKIAIAGVSAAMLVGAGSGLLLSLPGGVGAADDNTSTEVSTEATTEPTTDASTGVTTDTGTDTGTDRGSGFKDSLDELVTAGTITQEQADAISAAVEANRPADGMGHRGPGGGHGGPGRGKFAETAATALGMTTAELQAELEAGKTVAEVAAEKGVDVQTVIDAIVAEQTANIVERVTNHVNGVKPELPTDTSTADTGTTDTGS